SWEDPDFDPTVRAFYYLRALEVPSPRYTAYDYVDPSVSDEDRAIFDSYHIPHAIQERAWSSPIWYTPTPEQLAQGEANALKVTDPSLVPLTEAETMDLLVSNLVKITNLSAGEALTNFYGPLNLDNSGTWLPISSDEASFAALHIAENISATRKYAIAGNQVSFNLEDGSEFVAELFNHNSQIVAARDDEIGYVNYQVDVLIDVFDEPCCPESGSATQEDCTEPLPAQADKNVSHEDFWDTIIQQVEKRYSTK
ncbi:MAG: DUF3604 domain-containing protein, partial [Moorea sp. SIO2B7]|nr:DUF3604 domain-containing protein [Moorena sp. SIO2B7]